MARSMQTAERLHPFRAHKALGVQPTPPCSGIRRATPARDGRTSMNELTDFWTQWLRPSAGLPTVQWALLLAVATVAFLTLPHSIAASAVMQHLT